MKTELEYLEELVNEKQYSNEKRGMLENRIAEHQKAIDTHTYRRDEAQARLDALDSGKAMKDKAIQYISNLKKK